MREVTSRTEAGHLLERQRAAISVSAEAAGQEVRGLIGACCHIRPGLEAALAITCDNRGAVLFRPGLTYSFNPF